MTPDDLDGWIPSRIRWRDGDPVVEWRWLGECRFTEPFHSETLNRALRNPFALLFRRETPMEALRVRAGRHPGLTPTGFIFHMSRCGSTLIGQGLSVSSENVVISEAPVIDSLLRGGAPSVGKPFIGKPLDPQQRIAWLRWLIAALGQKRTGQETRYFIKLDCWHVPWLPLLRTAFPDVPWIFLYRDPVEVLASHEALPALWRVPGMLSPELIGMDLVAVRQMDRLEYCARVLGKVCESALSFQADRQGKFVNYTELPEAIWTTIASHFGMQLSPGEIAVMRDKVKFDAKVPGLRFTNDSEAKRRRASAHAATLAERWLAPVYRDLERARTEQNHPVADRV